MAVTLSLFAGAGAQFFDNNGNPLTGGKLYTYAAGTTTPLATYTTNSDASLHTNPIVLDAAGRVPSGGEIWLQFGAGYKFAVKTSSDVLIATYDNIPSSAQPPAANDADSIMYEQGYTVTAGSFVAGKIYRIVTIGTTDFTLIGATANSVGLHFIATGAGTGTGTAELSQTVETKLREFVSVTDFGADPTGASDSTAAIAAAFAASARVSFPNGSYLMNSGVTVLDDDIEVDFGNATIINGGAGFTFVFGATADTPQNSGLKVTGGYFTQSNPATTSNLNYIRVAGFSDYIISGCNMKNVSNGGIYIEAGTENGLIDACTLIGSTAYSTIRGIWLIGATASDYQSNYMDDSSLTRNATAFPVFAVKNCRVTNCKIAVGSYGIYNMNTRDCVFENNHISNFGGLRGITINTYSPRAIIKNNTIIASQSSSGILVTQASNGVIIDGNTFQGNFDGGRAIQVQYLAEALVTNNYFFSTGSQAIDINTAGTATIRGNYFKRAFGANTRAVYALPVDRNVAGTGVFGDTATKVPGFVFEDNTISGWGAGVLLETDASSSGNEPGWQSVIVRGNLMYEMNLATTSSEYLLRPVNTSTTQSFTVQYYDNWVFPETAAIRNRPLVSGDVVFERSDYYLAAFTVSVAVSGGAITVTKSYGANLDLSVTRVGTNLSLIPRSPKGSTGGQAVPDIVGITPVSNNFVTFKLTNTTNDWTIELIDSAGSALDMTSVAATFVVHLSTNVT